MKERREKKPPNQVVSFTLPAEVKERLDQKERHTLFVQALVTKNLGFCPVCNGRWPRKRKELTDERKEE